MFFFFFFESFLIYRELQRRQWQPTPFLLPGKSRGQRSLVGCSPWGREESDTNECLHIHFSLWCIGEGNGNPLQWSCLENPRDGGAWWAAVYAITQSPTRLKRLSSSSRDNTEFRHGSHPVFRHGSHPLFPSVNMLHSFGTFLKTKKLPLL